MVSRRLLRNLLNHRWRRRALDPELVREKMAAVDRDELLALVSGMPHAVEDYPFGEEVAVFKVGGKMFALVSLDGEPGVVNLKCDPALALQLRQQYAAVRPGYHQNKRHWNSVDLDGSLDAEELREMVQHSYDLVVASLPRRSWP
ncbi:MAG TPA: MmcQ/YjbR family DNA-binding protein [Nocardioides sp.]|nr:MmcQ/YjbR family DNA-binding protein [Nocardioides sp.]